jgi:hypothetical protein
MAAGPQHRLQESAGGALAVGAADDDHRHVDAQPEPVMNRAHAREAHRDGLRVQRLEIRQPAGQRVALAKPRDEPPKATVT